jgi:predicted O-methyltransferase YrrM
MTEYKDLIDKAIYNAEKHISKITEGIKNMDGMSGLKTRHFYNNLLDTTDARYLEIGTWKGSSVCSAMCGNKATVVCIDNWSEFGGPKEEFITNFNTYKGENNASFIEKDCFQVDTYTLPKFNIYMYDGNHSKDSHYNALLHYYNCLDNTFIFIVDDWNWRDVREGTFDSIRKLKLDVLYEKEIRLTQDNSHTDQQYGRETWWNGIYIAVLHKRRNETLRIDYKTNKSELCELGRIYDTDKSSQRDCPNNITYCHPYTLFYENLFRNVKNSPLKIAEIGILHGASLRMWRDYFTNSEIYGFEYDNNLITNFKNSFNNDRITLSHIDVTDRTSVIDSFKTLNQTFDIIIDDSTHNFEDQIRIIKNCYQYLRPGGVMIIEDIFRTNREEDYITPLYPIIQHFSDYYFLDLDHKNKNSGTWNNDKLFVLTKAGGEPLINNKLTIITPASRPANLHKLKQSINFNYVDEWIIVYDQSKISQNPNLFSGHPKIKEYIYTGDGISGNPQRNYALTKVSNKDTSLYYLDDDNIVHPDLYNLVKILDNTKIYTFRQFDRLKGNNIKVGSIDTAMFIIPFQTCKNVRWIPEKYDADGYYIKECYDLSGDNHIFVNNELCYYNKLV